MLQASRLPWTVPTRLARPVDAHALLVILPALGVGAAREVEVPMAQLPGVVLGTDYRLLALSVRCDGVTMSNEAVASFPPLITGICPTDTCCLCSAARVDRRCNTYTSARTQNQPRHDGQTQ